MVVALFLKYLQADPTVLLVVALFLKYLQADPFAGGVTVAVKLSVQTLLKQLGAVNGQSAVLLQAKEFYISYITLSGYN